MVRISITPAAFDAICATLPLGGVGYEAEPNEQGERLIWLEDAMADRLGATRGPGESYSRLRPFRRNPRMIRIAITAEGLRHAALGSVAEAELTANGKRLIWLDRWAF